MGVCERCGNNFVKKDESDVCGVCLNELDFEHQYEIYRLVCTLRKTSTMDYDTWLDCE